MAIDAVVGVRVALVEYAVRSITEGIDAQGDVTVRVRCGERVVRGHGADTDIVVASAKAYLAAINRVAPGLAAVEARA
jgi:2-isopropylmalate synthase